MPKVLLVGNPNCGKTTLFNLLTASNQRIGNWPGVTVEKKEGGCQIADKQYQIIDLPGVYSLSVDQNSAQDSRITAQEVVKSDVDLIINVINACHLERHLYLTTQLIELGKPVIVVLNMLDIAKSQHVEIAQDLLAAQLNCQVVAMQANKKRGLHELQQQILQITQRIVPYRLNYPKDLCEYIENNTQKLLQEHKLDESLAYYKICRELENTAKHANFGDIDILMANTRYAAIHEIVSKVQTKNMRVRETVTAKIDKVVLNRFFAIPIFVGIMYLMFLLSINIGSALQSFFNVLTEAIFIKGVGYWLTELRAPNWLITLTASGIGRGINTTASFIPVIALMYFFLSLLESSGYMARAAFVVDRLMRFLGLPGKSFVPMIVGFGCNVPGIMAARTLESERDRILTVMMSPFMSCSARLAIYVVFVSAFFPTGGHNIVFSLYLMGILMAVLTGYILKKTLLFGTTSPLIIELPAYHLPTFKSLSKEAFTRLRFFIIRAGRLIIPVCVVLSILDAWTISVDGRSMPVISVLGQKLVPAFVPMGIDADNWPAVVGLLTGTLAKEVVVGTLNSLYSHMAQLNQTMVCSDFNFMEEIRLSFAVLHANFVSLANSLTNPIAASVNNVELSSSAFGVMVASFQTKIAAYAYLLFVLLYIPCVSTMSAIKQETNRRYMWLAIFWSLFLAYFVATIFYQSATWFMGLTHMQQALSGASGMLIFAIIIVSKSYKIWRGKRAL